MEQLTLEMITYYYINKIISHPITAPTNTAGPFMILLDPTTHPMLQIVHVHTIIHTYE